MTLQRSGLLLAESGSPQASRAVLPSKGRDLRLDFFRGLALICIFIDHVPGNSLSSITLRALGFSDAAEVFVLIAGFAAYLAYAGTLERDGLWQGAIRVGRRIRDLYAAHLLLMALCAGMLAVAARYFENPLYFEHVNLSPLSYDPLGAIWRLAVLYFQLGYLNILPLYMVLLAWFPVLWWLLKARPALALGISTGLWASAGLFWVNLPSWPETYGWFFNPFAWQLLFSIGAYCALRSREGATLPRSPWLIGIACLVLVLGFVIAAPWVNIPGLRLPRLVPYDALGHISKTNLSPWRLAHVLSLAYLVALAVPLSARWLQSRPARAIIACGRNGLVIFCLATVLSFIGLIVMLEAGRSFEYQVAVNALGIGVMLCAARWITVRKTSRVVAEPAAAPVGVARAVTVRGQPRQVP